MPRTLLVRSLISNLRSRWDRFCVNIRGVFRLCIASSSNTGVWVESLVKAPDVEAVGHSGVPSSGVSGYSGNTDSGVSGYSGNTDSGVSGYSGVPNSGVSGYSGNTDSGGTGYSDVSAISSSSASSNGVSNNGGAGSVVILHSSDSLLSNRMCMTPAQGGVADVGAAGGAEP